MSAVAEMTSELITHLDRQFRTLGDSRNLTFLREDGRELVSDVATFSELRRRAHAVAVWLAHNADPQRPVLLLMEPGLDFWQTFLGCVYAGVPAIPAPLPHDQRSMLRVASILNNAGANLAITSAHLRDVFVHGIGALDLDEPIEIVATDAIDADPDAWSPPAATDDSVAFLQYTSGSTGDPKGVSVTHGNLMANENAIAAATGQDSNSVVIGWIPHFHDMGLIGGMLAFHIGANLVAMAPMAFLKQPVRFLRAISEHRGTIAASPNFAYDLITRRVTPEQLAGIDLSSLQVAINGAEPIRRRTVERITEFLAPFGFAPSAMRPAYGMAEVTLLATVCRDHPNFLAADSDALENHHFVPALNRVTNLVSSGSPAPGVEVMVVDPDTLDVLAEDSVGEIWLRGGSVARGYHNRPDVTAERFHAHTSTGDGPFLRTGDLGFLHNRELYVTGRCKDLLIVNGRNLYPQDIEDFMQDVHPAIEGSRGVAVAVDAGDAERLVVIQAVRPALLGELTLAELASKLKIAIARGFDVPAPSVVFVNRSGIHLTTSGKVQRASMKAAFQTEQLTEVLHTSIDGMLAAAGAPR